MDQLAFWTDRETLRLSWAQRGIYLYLICRSWQDDGLDPDLDAVHDVVVGATRADDSVAAYVLSDDGRAWLGQFVERLFPQGEDGRRRNARLEGERERLQTRRDQAKAASESRWRKERAIRPDGVGGSDEEREETAGMLTHSQSESESGKKAPPRRTSSSSSSLAPSRPEPATGADDVLVWIPCVRGKNPRPNRFDAPMRPTKSPKVWEYGVRPSEAAELRDAYPGVQMIQELKGARRWVLDNPTRKKTYEGMPSFLAAWTKKAHRQVASLPGQRAQAGSVLERIEKRRQREAERGEV